VKESKANNLAWQELYGPKPLSKPKPKPKRKRKKAYEKLLNIGQYVRLSLIKPIFSKETNEQGT
jgi:hypothetical protein